MLDNVFRFFLQLRRLTNETLRHAESIQWVVSHMYTGMDLLGEFTKTSPDPVWWIGKGRQKKNTRRYNYVH